MTPPRVFISYSHDSDSHKRRVLGLSDRLRSEGVDCNVDQYEMAPVDGWPRWMRNQIQSADFVIVVCTETYEQRYEGKETHGTGVGAKWEGAIITQQLYESEGKNRKFIPVTFSSQDTKHIPLEMRGRTWCQLDSDRGYDLLYRVLTVQPPILKRSLGKLRTLPPLERESPEDSLQKLRTGAGKYSLRAMLAYVSFKLRYFEHLVYKYRTYRTQGLMTKGPFTLDLEKVFISLRVAAESPVNVSPDLIRRAPEGEDLSIWDFLGELPNRIEHHRHIVVLGGPGSGKTTLLEHLALTYALRKERQQHSSAQRLVPVLIHLRDVRNLITSDQPPNIVELIERQDFVRKLKPPSQWFEDRMRQKKCLVMLDGLDEVADETQRKRVSSWVNEQLEAYPTPFILTSRPFGYTSAPIENVGVTLEVQPFNSSEMELFINNWYLQTEIMRQVRREDPGVREEAGKKAADLVTRIKNSPAIGAMAVNPLLLTMIATIHAIRAVLPGKRVELYAEICDVLLGRRQEAKGIPDPLTAIQKRAVLQVLAFELMQRETREFTRELACELIEGILSAVTNEDEIDPKRFIEQIQNVSGLIVEKTIGIFEFAHQSFQEFLAAVQIKATNQDLLLVDKIHESWWSETIRLYSAQGDATAIIRAALEKPSVVALTIASDCLEEAAIIEPEMRRQLDRTLREGIESNEPLIARMAAEVKLSLRLNRISLLSDNVEIDPANITCAEYQLFIDDMLKEGLYRQPDHWTSTRFLKGQGDAPVAGVRASDGKEFCEWLNRRYGSRDLTYRLPDPVEASSVADSAVGTWCQEGDMEVIRGVASDDWSIWQNHSSVYVQALKHVFGPKLNHSAILELARNLVFCHLNKHNISDYIDSSLMPDATHVLEVINRLKAQSDFLFRELNVTVSNVVPLTRDLADEVGIETGLACDLLERELNGLTEGPSFRAELTDKLSKARLLAHNIGLGRRFSEELSRDLQNTHDYVTSHDVTPGFGQGYVMSRSPDCDHVADRSRLLLECVLWSLIGSRTEQEDKETVNPAGLHKGGPMNVQEFILACYLCLQLVAKRREGQMVAWEGIKIVRERPD